MISAPFVLTLSIGLGIADEKKPVALVGIIKKVDADKGILVVTVKGKEAKDADVEILIGDKTKFVALGRDGKKEFTGKAGLKADAFKPGSKVHIFYGSDGKVAMVLGVPSGAAP
jgi:hypothetical protein